MLFSVGRHAAVVAAAPATTTTSVVAKFTVLAATPFTLVSAVSRAKPRNTAPTNVCLPFACPAHSTVFRTKPLACSAHAPRSAKPANLLLFSRQAHSAPSLSSFDTSAATARERELAEEPDEAETSTIADADSGSGVQDPIDARTEHRVFVGNVSFEANGDDVLRFFRQFANVREVHLPIRPVDGKPRGYAFIHLENCADAERVVHEANGKEFFGRPLIAKGYKQIDEKRKHVNTFIGERLKSTIWVGNLAGCSTAKDVGQLYLPFGEIKEVYMPKIDQAKKPANYALVVFAEAASAEKAVKATNNSRFQGRTITARPATARLPTQGLPLEATQICVQNISYQTTREQLEEYYKYFGPVAYVALPRRSIDGLSRGYAFVVFQDAAAARNARGMTDGKIFQGRQLKVDYATKNIQRDPQFADVDYEPAVDCETVVYVKDLPLGCMEADLAQFFSERGTVEEVYIQKHPGHVGIVRFASRKDARKAIRKTTGTEFMGSIIYPSVQRYEKRCLEDPGFVESKSPVLNVQGLPTTATIANVTEHFQTFGEVTDVRLWQREESGEQMSYGYVYFKSAAVAQQAAKSLNQSDFQGRTIFVEVERDQRFPPASRFPSPSDSSPRRMVGPRLSIYVSQLPYEITHDELWHFFSQFGKVLDVHLPTRGDSGLPSGYGFVRFSTAEEAERAMIETNGINLKGRIITVDAAKAK